MNWLDERGVATEEGVSGDADDDDDSVANSRTPKRSFHSPAKIQSEDKEGR
jgi:hypothetical protein